MKKLSKRISSSKAKATRGRRLDISLTGVIDNIAFSRADSWAYYRLTNSAYDFLSLEERGELSRSLNIAFSSIMAERKKPLNCILVGDSVPVDIDSWYQQNLDAVGNRPVPPKFEDYMRGEMENLASKDYKNKVVYLGIHLGSRRESQLDAMNLVEAGISGAADIIKTQISQIMQQPDIEISASEEEKARIREKEFFQIVSQGALRASRCSSQEILLMLKRQLFPSMPSPYLSVDPGERIGTGDIALETSHEIVNRARWLEITQMVEDVEMKGYRACLAMSKFPKEMVYPYNHPFFYLLERYALPFPVYSRFTFHPSETMRKEMDKKRKEHKDELKNIAVGQDSFDSASGLPPDVLDSLQDEQAIREIITRDKSPWIDGSYYVVVETPTEELLKKYCASVKQHFSEHDINISWPSGSQAKLFLQQMPADHVRFDSFDQQTTCSQIGGSGISYSSEVGDVLRSTSTFTKSKSER